MNKKELYTKIKTMYEEVLKTGDDSVKCRRCPFSDNTIHTLIKHEDFYKYIVPQYDILDEPLHRSHKIVFKCTINYYAVAHLLELKECKIGAWHFNCMEAAKRFVKSSYSDRKKMKV